MFFLKKIAIEYQKYLAFLLSKPNYFFQFAMGYPVVSVKSVIFGSAEEWKNGCGDFVSGQNYLKLTFSALWQNFALIKTLMDIDGDIIM